MSREFDFMIDPNEVHLYSAPKNKKEEFLLFCLCVAGKTAIVQAAKLDAMIKLMGVDYGADKSPFELIQKAFSEKALRKFLEQVKLGQYTRLTSCMTEVSLLGDVEQISLEKLESIKGIGPKTARFFLLYTQKGSQYAVFDTHVLKWMKITFPEERVPLSTPSIKRYKELETLFLSYCKQRKILPEDIDLEIWKGKGKIKVPI